MDPLSSFRLDGKVVVVTGASSGLGVGFARVLASELERESNERDLRRFAAATTSTVATAERLRAVLDEACDRGYAAEVEENEPGIACVAVALLRAGRPVAAVSITAPVERMAGAARDERAGALRDVLAGALPTGLTVAPRS
jgi:DNA-binding IclR family transcriptional regulator